MNRVLSVTEKALHCVVEKCSIIDVLTTFLISCTVLFVSEMLMQVEVVFIEVSAVRLSFIGTANLMNREICLSIIGNVQLVVVNILVKRS